MLKYLKKQCRFAYLLCAIGCALLSVSCSDSEGLSSRNYSRYFKALPFEMKPTEMPTIPDFTIEALASDSAFIQQAIDSASAMGGGTVIVPAGSWVSAPIELKSNVELRLSKGAIVSFSTDPAYYEVKESWYEGQKREKAVSPISATNAENIAITGEGIFDGNGEAWRPVKQMGVSPSLWRNFIRKGGFLSEDEKTWSPLENSQLRPVMVDLEGCKKVLLKGVTFRNSPAWCLHPVLCQNVIIDGVKMLNESYATNGDALDIESCCDVLVKDCLLDAGDDAICIKSGKDEEGRRRGVPTERVVIDGCTVYNGHGGFVIGSEMSGGVRNVIVSNCTFTGTDNGLRFKSCRGRGGVVENIWCNNIHMNSIRSKAILFDLYYFTKGEREIKPVDETTPSFHHIYMDGITCSSAGSVGIMQGLPEMPLHDVELSNVQIKGDTPFEAIDTADIRFRNVLFIAGDSVWSSNDSFIKANEQNQNYLSSVLKRMKCDKQKKEYDEKEYYSYFTGCSWFGTSACR